MKYLILLVSFLAFPFSSVAAERIAVTESVAIAATADAVWDQVKAFDGIDQWHPAFTSAEIVEGSQPARGTIRQIEIDNGAVVIRETLTDYDDDKRSMSYVINSIPTGALPIQDYASTISVLQVGDAYSLLIWSGNFSAAEGVSAEDAQQAIAGVYQAGLVNVRQMLAGE